MKKVIKVSALNPCNWYAICFNFVFSDQEVDNYKHRYELRFLLQEWEYIVWVMLL